MKPKLIKTETDYHEALGRIEAIFDAKPDTPEGDELELLVTLVECYEEKAYPIGLPSPVDAIRFRMQQEGLKAKDLIPYIGSASKVSEVLSGKRPLSLAMIRKLVSGLGIPAEVLLQEQGAELPSDAVLEQGRHFPVAEMVKRGWFVGFSGTVAEAKNGLEDLLNSFVGALGSKALMPALNRQHVRDGSQQDQYALMAWRIRVANLALCQSLPAYRPGTVTPDFLQEVVHLSYLERGPLLAKEFLNKNGIHLICEPHLPKTHLDGAAFRLPEGSPVVALTLRYDRLDNFWFTLCHELAHVALHLDQGEVETFFDDVSQVGMDEDDYEKEADILASESLIPKALWESAQLTKRSSSLSVVEFAERIRISPAIPAGRIRLETKTYMRFNSLLGSGTVKAMFGIT